MSRPRKSLPFAAWPATDRAAWDALFADGDILEGRGAGWHWSEATRRTNAKHYARWLGWLAAQGALTECADPTARVTPVRVEAYARHLLAGSAPKTVESYVRDLKVVVKAMRPERDWRWLMDQTNRLKAWAKPRREAERALPSTHALLPAVLGELERLAKTSPETQADLLACRDALLLGVLLAAPMRRKNIAGLRIGTHLERLGEEWHIRVPGDETKTGTPLHYVVPGFLAPHLARYLETVRPRLPGAATHDGLWPGGRGRPMSEHSVYDRVRTLTQRLVGIPVPPHALRSIAATYLAEHSPADALRARPLLGHRRQDTTETHYIRARQIDASCKINTLLEEMRGERG